MADEILIQLANSNNKNYKDSIKKFKDKFENPDRTVDRGIVSEDNSSSILVKDNGNVQIASSITTSTKYTSDKIINTAQEIHDTTNRKILDVDEVIINNQKLNPQLLELSDTKVLFDSNKDAIGNLTMDGTVLVKAWDLNLNKYVLIRRRIRTPLFSHKLNYPDTPELMDVSSSLITDLSINTANLLLQEKEDKELLIAEMQKAEGGTTYNQGEYNNYLTDFLVSSTSISSQRGMNVNTSTTSETPFQEGVTYTSEEDIISVNTSGVDFIWPVPEQLESFTSDFGYRTINGKKQWHNGVDMRQNYDLGKKTRICAAADGVVKDIRLLQGESLPPYTGYGKIILLEHPTGLFTLYAHLDQVLVKKGQQVKQGQHIGYMGTTGQSTGVHLHFTIYGNYNGKYTDIKPGLNPNYFIKPQN